MLIGQGGFMLILTTAGLIQGGAWINGEAFYRVLPEMHVYMVARAIDGSTILVAAYIMLYNVIRTLRSKSPDVEPDQPRMSVREIAPGDIKAEVAQ
jgi:cytochrome c oxidase cbb3-type subunit 1/cytochrome c oxidase cbb3-type subunit I/II